MLNSSNSVSLRKVQIRQCIDAGLECRFFGKFEDAFLESLHSDIIQWSKKSTGISGNAMTENGLRFEKAFNRTADRASDQNAHREDEMERGGLLIPSGKLSSKDGEVSNVCNRGCRLVLIGT
jgi:hypothetical protein